MNLPQGNVWSRVVEMIRRAGKVFLSRKTPWYVKLLLGMGLVYILSPYDLIPEGIPVLGILDDMALAALLIAWASSYHSE